MKRNGFTLIELIISVAVTAILFTFGLSAYVKSRDRQEIRAIGETIEKTLRETQKDATIGKKDCENILIEYLFTFENNASNDAIELSKQARCTSSSGQSTTTIIENAILPDISTPLVIKFKPLNGGIDIGGTNELDIDFQSTKSEVKHRISIEAPGSIQYKGRVE